MRRDNCHFTLLGTAHVSRASADQVARELEEGSYDAVAVELCPSRFRALVDPDALARMDLVQVLRQGQIPMVSASLALSAFQQRIAQQFGIEPGAEMRTAVRIAQDRGIPVWLIDREVGVTLKRVYHNLPWWRRFQVVGGLLGSLLSREEVSEAEIERLKEGDILESSFAQFAEQAQDLYLPLIAERDRYMAARLQMEQAQTASRRVLAVIGAGHLAGLESALCEGHPDPRALIEELDQTPRRRRWGRLIPWIIVGLILLGFFLGFRRSPELGWQLIADWVLINGGLAALGATLAGGHLLTVLTAFLAAPFTSLNPLVGAGMVTAGTELMLRRPTVGDFERLRQDTTSLGGWWRNRVSRVLLVFLFSTLGSAAGTYLAGFLIFDRLASG